MRRLLLALALVGLLAACSDGGDDQADDTTTTTTEAEERAEETTTTGPASEDEGGDSTTTTAPATTDASGPEDPGGLFRPPEDAEEVTTPEGDVVYVSERKATVYGRCSVIEPHQGDIAGWLDREPPEGQSDYAYICSGG